MFLGHSVGQCLPYNEAEAKCPLQWGIWESYILFCTGTDCTNLFIQMTYLVEYVHFSTFHSSLYCNRKGKEKGRANVIHSRLVHICHPVNS